MLPVPHSASSHFQQLRSPTYSARITSRWRAGTTEACSTSSEPAEARRLEGVAACFACQACPAHRVHRCSSGPWSLPNHAACWTCDLAPSILLQSRSAITPRPSSCPRATCIRGCCSLLLFRCSKGQALAWPGLTCRFQVSNPTEWFTWVFAETLPP